MNSTPWPGSPRPRSRARRDWTSVSLPAGRPGRVPGKTLGQVLTLLAKELQTSNSDIANALATETVFEHGFDPLDGGFRPAQPYQIFDQWTEVLPTDQVVAVQVQYDPRTGQQLPPQA